MDKENLLITDRNHKFQQLRSYNTNTTQTVIATQTLLTNSLWFVLKTDNRLGVHKPINISCVCHGLGIVETPSFLWFCSRSITFPTIFYLRKHQENVVKVVYCPICGRHKSLLSSKTYRNGKVKL